jgi:hypothetical protein
MDYIMEKLQPKINKIAETILTDMFLDIKNGDLTNKKSKHYNNVTEKIHNLLKEQIEPYENALVSLTPNGSEYVGQPKACYEYLNNRFKSLTQQLKTKIKEIKKIKMNNNQLEQELINKITERFNKEMNVNKPLHSDIITIVQTVIENSKKIK